MDLLHIEELVLQPVFHSCCWSSYMCYILHMLLAHSNLNAVLESDTFNSQPCLSVTGQPSKLLYVMHNSETPLSCLALFEGGPSLIADANFDVLMVKLKSHFQNAKGHKVECRGSRYRYCDFLIKVGTVTMSSSARGISVEVCTHTLKL